MQFSGSIQRNSRQRQSRAALAAMLAAAAATGIVNAQSTYQGPPGPTFAPVNTNQWSVPGNWDAGVPNAVDAIAQVLYGTATEIEIDNVFTIGQLILNPAANVNYTFPTKPTSFDPTKGLTFAVTSGNPIIDVQSSGANAFFYNTLFGTQGIEKVGPGKLTFRFNTADMPYSGNVRVSGGVFGIQKDGSLGNADNDIFLGAVAPGVTTATLTAEPSDNLDVTLPASRAVTLTGAGAQLSGGGVNYNFTVAGDISDGAGSFGLAVTGGLVTLAGNNSYDGITSVTGGGLVAAKPAALPGWDSAGRVSANNASVMLRVGGAGEFVVADLDTLRTANGGSFTATSAVGVDTTNATGPVSWAGLTSGEAYSLAKAGPGTLRLTGVNNYTGTRLRMFGGTVELAPGAALPSNINVIFLTNNFNPTVDLGGNSQTIANMDDGSGFSVKVTNGTLTLNAASTVTFGGNSGQSDDFSGLSGFTYQQAGATNIEFKFETVNNVNNTQNTMLLAGAGPAGGVNLIKAANRVVVGGAATTSATGTHRATVRLGTDNTINTNLLQLGAFNSTGRINFQDGLTNPILKVRAFDGTSAIPTMLIGETSSGVRDGGGDLNLSNGRADILATTITLGRHIAQSDNPDNSALSIGGGTLSAQTLIMAEKRNRGNPTNGLQPILNSTLNVSGGQVSVDTIVFGSGALGAATPAPNNEPLLTRVRPTINLSGGTLSVASIAPNTGTFSDRFSEAESIRTINLSGAGVLTHTASADLTVSGIASLDADPLTTGNLVFVRVPGGTPTVYADAGRRITFTDTTVIADSCGATPTFGTLVKAGAGGLQVNGAINNDLPIKVDQGAVQVSNGAVPTRADVNATFVVDYTGSSVLPAVQANIVAGYNGGAWDGATGYISSAAAASTTPKGALGYAEASVLYGAGPTTVNGLSVDDSAVVVKYTVAGDANLDGTANIADFSVLGSNFNLPGGWGAGDFNYDGTVNIGDFSQLAANFNLSIPSSTARPGAVPEPASLGLLVVAGAALTRRRRSV